MADFKDLSLDLLKRVVMCDVTAVEAIDKACRHSNFDVSYKIQFNFYRKGRWIDWTGCYCECWYVNEHFEYATSSGVGLELFETICGNVKLGNCPHAIGQEVNVASSGISLIHAAAAAGNKPVVKYLLKRNKHLKFHTTQSANIPPFILAILKNQTSILTELRVDVWQAISECKQDRRRPFPEGKYLDLYHMVIASRDNKSGKVIINGTVGSYSNPFVCCFYTSIVASKQVIDVIKDQLNAEDIHDILQYVIYKYSNQITTYIVSCFSHHVSRFDTDLILECVLWDKPEALRILAHKINNRSCQCHYSGYSFASIAKFLGHGDCVRMLQNCKKLVQGQLSVREQCRSHKRNVDCETDGEQIMSPFTAILTLERRKSSYEYQDICKLLQKISTKQYDINERNSNGMTPMHIALETIHSRLLLMHVLETLLRREADGNLKDINGRSALYLTLTPFNSPLGLGNSRYHVLRIMKIVLYYNAVPKYTPNAVLHAISRDKMNSFLTYVDDNSVSIILTRAENRSQVLARTNTDKFLALSFVAILMELGFRVEKNMSSLCSNLPDSLGQYVNNTLCTPRSLQSSCRNVIRDTYPGPELHQFLASAHIPDAISDIILFKPYLLRTEIELSSGEVIDDSNGYGF